MQSIISNRDQTQSIGVIVIFGTETLNSSLHTVYTWNTEYMVYW